MPEQMIDHNWSVNGLLPVFARAALGYFLAELGEFDAGFQHAEEALRAARAADKPYSLIFACGGVRTLHPPTGEPGDAGEVVAHRLPLFPAPHLPLGPPVPP